MDTDNQPLTAEEFTTEIAAFAERLNARSDRTLELLGAARPPAGWNTERDGLYSYSRQGREQNIREVLGIIKEELTHLDAKRAMLRKRQDIELAQLKLLMKEGE